MKTIYYLIVLNYFYLGCNLSNHDLSETHKIIPDNTPFITGIIEYTNDTTHYYTQVVVGTVSDIRFVDKVQELKNIKGLHNPTQLAQVVFTTKRFGLQFYPEDSARVFVTGPLNDNHKNKVELFPEGNGVYGDKYSILNLEPAKNYQLEVIYQSGKVFQSSTYIPESVEIFIPDSIGLNVHLEHYEDGTPREESSPHYWIPFEYPSNTYITETQQNTSFDRELLFMEPWESFRFSDRGPFLRSGLSYGIWKTGHKTDSVRTGWWLNILDPWFNKSDTKEQWRRFSFYSDGMWRNHQNLDDYIVSVGEWEEMHLESIEAANQKDSTYLKRVSTIDEIGPDGEILPKDEANVIGFFAGSFAVYKKTVVYPIRSFDIDSVLTAHGLNND